MASNAPPSQHLRRRNCGFGKSLSQHTWIYAWIVKTFIFLTQYFQITGATMLRHEIRYISHIHHIKHHLNYLINYPWSYFYFTTRTSLIFHAHIFALKIALLEITYIRLNWATRYSHISLISTFRPTITVSATSAITEWCNDDKWWGGGAVSCGHIFEVVIRFTYWFYRRWVLE